MTDAYVSPAFSMSPQMDANKVAAIVLGTAGNRDEHVGT